MPTFICNKLGRDKGLETFKKDGITPHYHLLTGKKLQEALICKLLEECNEVQEADNVQEMIAELADVLAVINGLCKAYGISLQEVIEVQNKKYQERGGFEKGLYIESLEMDENNPKIQHFRKSPHKYPEIK